jgi:hypothetical protein
VNPDEAPLKPRPPAIVWTAFALLLAIGLLGIVSLVLAIVLVSRGQAVGGTALIVGGLLTLLQCAGYIVAAVFLLRRARWARVLGIVMVGVNLALSLLQAMAGGGISLPGLLLAGAALFLLLRRETVDWVSPA